MRWALVAMGCAISTPAWAIEFDDLGGEPLTLDVSNTSELGYHFDNRNDVPTAGTIQPSQRVDDNYGEWLNRLYVRAYYWKFSAGLRLDSVIYFNTLNRESSRALIIDELGAADLDLENRFAREQHARYTSLIYPSKLWLGFKHKRIEATIGDFYAQLGRGLVFSARKVDEVGIDTTVRGVKLKAGTKFGGFRLESTAFAGQLNPLRFDAATGRVLHGSGSPLFFGFPDASDFSFYRAANATDFVETTERAKPSYLEDTVIGGNVTMGPKQIQIGANAAALLRQSNSEALARCTATASSADAVDACRSEHPSFSTPESTRAHDEIINFSGTVRVPDIAETVGGYLEIAGQRQQAGRVNTIAPSGDPNREEALWGLAVYANVNLSAGPLTATLEGKHYRSFFPLGGNIDFTTQGFSAPEYSIANYSRPPTAEAIYVEPIGAPDVCISGGKARVDAGLSDGFRIYGWLGRFTSFTEADPSNNRCDTDDKFRTDTWDTAAGGELDLQEGKTHYWAWVGARLTDFAQPTLVNPEIGAQTEVFYREGYVRYDINQHIAGAWSVSALGNHRRRFEPQALAEVWHEGENLLAINYSPHFSFMFGYEYQTRPGLPTHYFNGGLQYRSQDSESWYGQLTDAVRLFVGQRRAALRCAGGVCRVFPALEGAKLELVSRF